MDSTDRYLGYEVENVEEQSEVLQEAFANGSSNQIDIIPIHWDKTAASELTMQFKFQILLFLFSVTLIGLFDIPGGTY